MSTTPTPRGLVPPAADEVPVPEFIAIQTTPLILEPGTDGKKKAAKKIQIVKRPGRKGGNDVKLNPAAAVYVMGYRRGWTDSAAHYALGEALQEAEREAD
jgi:hypothetical protein